MTKVDSTLSKANANAPQVISDLGELRQAIGRLRAAGQTIGFVPTMGALHAGHLSLVEASRRETGATVVSIFVNPTQFSAGEDLDRYPRNLAADLALLAPLGVSLVFAPQPQDVYPPGHSTVVEVSGVAEPWEGRVRPGHFAGVATVVLKLFHMVAPDIAFFGQKDYQQTLVVRRMVEDLNVPVQLRICPTTREPDGLAMSSRNAYLSAADRQRGLVLSRSLKLACELFQAGETIADIIRQRMLGLFAETAGVTLDYLAIVEPGLMGEVSQAQENSVAIIAARVGNVRLIDNCILGKRDVWQTG